MADFLLTTLTHRSDCTIDRDTLREVGRLYGEGHITLDTANNILRARVRQVVTLKPREEFL
jgi:hypothetical protein